MVNLRAIASKVHFLEVIKSFFVMLKEDIYVLIRIEFLVALVTVMFFVMFILDIYRCRSRSSFLSTVLTIVDNLSDHIVAYLLGAMQSARFENQMLPVWAIVLVSLRLNLGYLSGYNISDHERRLTELGNVIKFLGVGFLNGARGLEFSRPLWSLWAILLLRSFYRCYSHHMAINSLWHGRSSEFLPQYLSAGSRDCEQGNRSASTAQQESNDLPCNGAENNPSYPVYGESKQKIKLKRPGYTLHLKVVDPGSLITLENIMKCPEKLLTSDNNQTYKDMSRAFTLSRLLRCRLEDVPLHKEINDSTRVLIKSIINCTQQTASAATEPAKLAVVPEAAIEMQPSTSAAAAVGTPSEMTKVAPEMAPRTEPAASEVATVTGVDATVAVKCAFKILELELAFVRDYFYTLYPVVFWKGLSSLCFSLLLSMVTFALALWLAVGIRKAYQASDYYLVAWVGRCNVDVIITWVFLSFMMFKEVWEIVTYLLSNWTRILLVCKYVQSGLWFMKCTVTEVLISSFFMSNIVDPWHGRIDQYDFLPSFSYKPSFWKLVNGMSLGKTPEKYDGCKSGKAIKIPECVKPAILQALNRIGLDNSQLSGQIPSLMSGSLEQFKQYRWALLGLGTCSEVILVWHIATSLCEIKLAQECGLDLTRPGFLQSAWSRLKTFACCTSKPYLVNENTHLTAELETDYHTATSLSRYCAYLLVFWSELLPDSFVIPDLIFEETLGDAREELNGCSLILDMYKKLMGPEQEAEENNQEALENNGDATENNQEATENNVVTRLRMNIVQQGATLGKDLIRMDKETRWKFLAGVWAELLVHIAPSWNAVDHKNNLESGGEFITLIWALLSHCGVEKSTLWDKNEAPVSNARTPISNNNPVVEKQAPISNAQAPQDSSAQPKVSDSQPLEEQPNDDDDDDGIISDQEPDTSDSTRRGRGNALADMVNQTSTVSEESKGKSPSTSTN